MAISNTLKDIREERNLVQADLAKAVGPCSDTIGRIERGERSASLEIAIRLARFLNMNVEDIFTLDEATSAHQKPGCNPRFLFILNQSSSISFFIFRITASAPAFLNFSFTSTMRSFFFSSESFSYSFSENPNAELPSTTPTV